MDVFNRADSTHSKKAKVHTKWVKKHPFPISCVCLSGIVYLKTFLLDFCNVAINLKNEIEKSIPF